MIRCFCFSTVTHLKTIHLILFFLFSCLPVIQACCPNRRKVHKEGRYPSGLNLRWMIDVLFIYWMLFCAQCKPEYKVPGLYVVDSIVRQSRHQFGADKDVFGPRFTKNMTGTFENLCLCPTEDRVRISSDTYLFIF